MKNQTKRKTRYDSIYEKLDKKNLRLAKMAFGGGTPDGSFDQNSILTPTLTFQNPDGSASSYDGGTFKGNASTAGKASTALGVGVSLLNAGMQIAKDTKDVDANKNILTDTVSSVASNFGPIGAIVGTAINIGGEVEDMAMNAATGKGEQVMAQSISRQINPASSGLEAISHAIAGEHKAAGLDAVAAINPLLSWVPALYDTKEKAALERKTNDYNQQLGANSALNDYFKDNEGMQALPVSSEGGYLQAPELERFEDGGGLDDPQNPRKPLSITPQHNSLNDPLNGLDEASNFLKAYSNSPNFRNLSAKMGDDSELTDARIENINNFNPTTDVKVINNPFRESSQVTDEGKVELINRKMGEPFAETTGHELGHFGFTNGDLQLPPSMQDEISKRNLAAQYIKSSKLSSVKHNDRLRHDADPNETRADLFLMRQKLQKAGIYDSIKGGEFTPEHLKQLKEKGLHNRLQKLYKDEDIIWLMNNLADNNDMKRTTLPKATDGGELTQEEYDSMLLAKKTPAQIEQMNAFNINAYKSARGKADAGGARYYPTGDAYNVQYDPIPFADDDRPLDSKHSKDLRSREVKDIPVMEITPAEAKRVGLTKKEYNTILRHTKYAHETHKIIQKAYGGNLGDPPISIDAPVQRKQVEIQDAARMNYLTTRNRNAGITNDEVYSPSHRISEPNESAQASLYEDRRISQLPKGPVGVNGTVAPTAVGTPANVSSNLSASCARQQRIGSNGSTQYRANPSLHITPLVPNSDIQIQRKDIPMKYDGGAVGGNSGMPVINQYGTGGTHSQNPNGGIPVDSNGTPTITSKGQPVATTEQGELAWNGYVFSARLR